MEGKRHTSYRSYSTNVFIQNQWSTALKLLGKTALTEIILSPETPWTLYSYIYFEDNTPYSAKYRWYIIIIIIVIKKGRQCKAERESDIHPISPKTPAPQYQFL